ncbi:MAG: DNA translocase FtsK, partial [Atopostipes sp.]|nr:DNA translocase FtsK [Atopostipes sp.]
KTVKKKKRKERKHVPIEGMQQTALPIENKDASESKDKIVEDTESSDEDLEINFVSDKENKDYQLPPLSLLDDYEQPDQSDEYLIIEENIKVLEETFDSFGVDASVVKANLGPAVTKYEVEPATGVKVSRIVNLADDIALAMAANDIRIEAPIPGKALIGIEVPNKAISMVHYKEVMNSLGPVGESHPLSVPLGRDIAGNVAVAELNEMPHLLIAGATGSGKSVGINVMIASILMRTKPHEVKMMLIDPKRVELNIYDGIPHLLTPVVTKPKKAARALQNIVEEMDKRYELFEMSGSRNLESYNEQLQKRKEKGEEDLPSELPYIVVVVDELSDLMMVAAKEVEDAIIRLAQMARAAGIHMILATQRPSVDVITGLIKANVPSRIAFATSSGTDSRTILDANGAEKLLGRGDMLFAPMDSNKAERIQGAFISDAEIQAITDFVREQQEVDYIEELIPKEKEKVGAGGGSDELYDDAYKLVIELDTASISMLQRKFRIGYNRAANIMDDLEANGIVSAQDGSKPRNVLVDSPDQENEENKPDKKQKKA